MKSILQDNVIESDITQGKVKYPIQVVELRDVQYGKTTSFPRFEYRIEPDFPFINQAVDLPKRQFCDCVDGCSPQSGCLCINLSSVTLVKKGRIGEADQLKSCNPFGSVFFECTADCSCAGKCTNHLMVTSDGDEQRNNRLEIFRSPRNGFSCRTLRAIRKGSFVCYLAGKVYSNTTNVTMNRDPASTPADVIFSFQDETRQLGFSVYMDKIANESRYFNSACCPNLAAIFVYREWEMPEYPIVAFIAIDEIDPGEELNFYYGDHWIMKNVIKNEKFFCRCKSVNFCVWPKQKEAIPADQVSNFVGEVREKRRETTKEKAKNRHMEKKNRQKGTVSQRMEDGLEEEVIGSEEMWG